MRVLYLHGFASSAQSSKATFLARQLAARGITLETPDLNAPDFGTITVTRMVAQVLAVVGTGDPAMLVGSSLGAFVAIQAALQRPAAVSQLVLLAPALDFGGTTRDFGAERLARWKTSDALEVFHYGYGRMIPVHYELYADAGRYDALQADLPMPTLVFQGRRDVVVDPGVVERWAAVRPGVELHMLDDDHQLLQSLDAIWSGIARRLLPGGAYQQMP